MAIRLTLSYRGAGYAGWQRQDNAVTVQEVLEAALGRLLTPEAPREDRPVVVSGAGRTDAGVHARGQVVHLARPGEPGRSVSLRGLVLGTNTHLPEDVRVMAAARVADGFHARKHAVGKEYSYRLTHARVVSPLDAPLTVQIPRRKGKRLDLAAVREASETLVGRHDFSAFALTGGAHTQPFRTVRSAVWEEEGEELRFRIVGDGFLRGMVRGLVGTLLEVGTGRRSVGGFARLLEGASRAQAGPTAPAHGLVLERVHYGADWAALDRWP